MGHIRIACVLCDELDAVEVKALSALPRTGDIDRLYFNTKALGSSHHGHKERHMPQSRTEIDKDVIFRDRSGCDHVEDVTHGRRLVGHHLQRWLQIWFARFKKLKNSAHQLVSVVEAQTGEGASRLVISR